MRYLCELLSVILSDNEKYKQKFTHMIGFGLRSSVIRVLTHLLVQTFYNRYV